MAPRVLILRAAGTNCERETAHAFELAGATTEAVHVNRLLESPGTLDQYQILAVPGGFSYGDDLSAGRILADQLRLGLGDRLRDFASRKPVIGICNGFQVLVKTDLLPGPVAGRQGQTCTLTDNTAGRFVDRWVTLDRRSDKCVWTRGIDKSEVPIAHGEGRFLCADERVRQGLWDDGRVVFTYAAGDDDPNGSTDRIAGVCDAGGLVLGLMPHPERHVSPFQHYAWTSRESQPEEGEGLRVFRNAVDYVG